MRLTCLRCGHQLDAAISGVPAGIICICGVPYEAPPLRFTGALPSERLANRLRGKAFRAAGLVRNWGFITLGLAALSVLCFPLGPVAAGVGLYGLWRVRGPLARYSGRWLSLVGIVVGLTAFVVEGIWVLRWWQARRGAELVALRSGVQTDLRGLLRAQRLHRASTGAFGEFKAFRFRPSQERYVFFLGPRDRAGENDDVPAEYPAGLPIQPAVGPEAFTAVAIGQIDGDDTFDVWSVNQDGDLRHVVDDIVDPQ